MADIRAALEQIQEHGAEVAHDIQDVGEEILMAIITDPAGNRVGIIENPLFNPAESG